MVGLTFRAILREDWTLTANQNLNLQDITAFSRETRHWDLKRKPGLKEQTVSIKELWRAGSPGMRRLWIADGSRHAIRHYLTSLKIKHQSLKHLGCVAPARCNCLCNNIVHQRGRSRRYRYCKRSRRWTAHYFVNLIAACVSLSVFVTHFSTAAPKHKQTEPRAGRREGEGGGGVKEGEKRRMETSRATSYTLNRLGNEGRGGDTKWEGGRRAEKCERMRAADGPIDETAMGVYRKG